VDAIRPGTDLVVVSQIVFTTGQRLPNLDHIVAAAHQAGALILVDGYHAVGVVEVRFEELGADFMIGGSYKYTRGGPGACWLAIHPRHLNSDLRTLDTGWFAKKEPFGYERTEEPEWAQDGDAWLESTPPVLTAYQANSGLAFTNAIGVDRLRTYNLAQQTTLREALRAKRVSVYEPCDPNQFGAFSLVPHKDPPSLVKALKAAGVNVDARGNSVRFGPDLLNSNRQLEEAAEITARCLA
jgi:kynureninase